MDAVATYLIQMVLPALVGACLWGGSYPIRRRLLARKGLYLSVYREGSLLLFFMFLTGLLALTLTPAGFWLAFLRRSPLPQVQPFQGGINLFPFRESWALDRKSVV